MGDHEAGASAEAWRVWASSKAKAIVGTVGSLATVAITEALLVPGAAEAITPWFPDALRPLVPFLLAGLTGALVHQVKNVPYPTPGEGDGRDQAVE